MLVGLAVLAGIAVIIVSRLGGSTSPGLAVNASGSSGPVLAPPVVLPASTGGVIDLASFRGKRNVLIYFYEHAG